MSGKFKCKSVMDIDTACKHAQHVAKFEPAIRSVTEEALVRLGEAQESLANSVIELSVKFLTLQVSEQDLSQKANEALDELVKQEKELEAVRADRDAIVKARASEWDSACKAQEELVGLRQEVKDYRSTLDTYQRRINELREEETLKDLRVERDNLAWHRDAVAAERDAARRDVAQLQKELAYYKESDIEERVEAALGHLEMASELLSPEIA